MCLHTLLWKYWPFYLDSIYQEMLHTSKQNALSLSTVQNKVCYSLLVAVESSIVNMPVPPIEQYWQNVFFSSYQSHHCKSSKCYGKKRWFYIFTPHRSMLFTKWPTVLPFNWYEEKNAFCQYCSIGGTGMLTMEDSTATKSEYSNIPTALRKSRTASE